MQTDTTLRCAIVGVLPDVLRLPSGGTDKTQVALAWQTMLRALDDYTADNRGDVGSWTRIAAMGSLVLYVRPSVCPR